MADERFFTVVKDTNSYLEVAVLDNNIIEFSWADGQHKFELTWEEWCEFVEGVDSLFEFCTKD